MAGIGATRVTFYDLAENYNGGELVPCVFPLTEAQDLLKDMPLYPANDLSTHRVNRNGALVSGTWRDWNVGIDPSKGIETPVREVLGNLESRLEVDTGILDQEADEEAFMDRKEYAHMEGLSNDIADALVTGSVSGGNHFDGIEARLSSASQTDAFSQNMVHDYGGTGSDLMSILAVQWGPDSVYGVYPRGHQSMGFKRDVRGIERVLDGNSKAFYAYVVRYAWNIGLVVADDRCVRRIANIETTGSTYNLLDNTNKGYIEPTIDALVSMKRYGEGAVLYMNRVGWGQLWKAQEKKTNVNYNVQNAWDSPERDFDGHMVRFTDSIGITETEVT